jgi:hypothetical protein
MSKSGVARYCLEEKNPWHAGTQDAHTNARVRRKWRDLREGNRYLIPRRLQDMVVTSYMQVRTRLTVAHSPAVGPCKSFVQKSLPLYIHR